MLLKSLLKPSRAEKKEVVIDFNENDTIDFGEDFSCLELEPSAGVEPNIDPEEEEDLPIEYCSCNHEHRKCY